MEKRHVQSCSFDGSIYRKKSSTGKKVSPNHRSVSKKELITVYNKFYRDQVTALYKAIHSGE